MSQENVEVVRSVIAANDRREYDAVFAAYDPGIQWSIEHLPGPSTDFERTYYGHDGVRAFWREWMAAWEVIAFDYEEFIDAGDRVIAILTQRMRGRTSGLELEWTSYAQVWTVRSGSIVRVEFFPSRTAAFEAAGLSE